MAPKVPVLPHTRRPGNEEQARALGADHVIDYTREDFARNGRRHDVICEGASHHSISAYKRSLNRGGRWVIAGIGFPDLSIERFFALLIVGPLRSSFGDKGVRFMGMARIDDKDLVLLGGLLDAGKIEFTIDRTYPLEQAAKAMRYPGTGHARGTVMVTVGQETQAS